LWAWLWAFLYLRYFLRRDFMITHAMYAREILVAAAVLVLHAVRIPVDALMMTVRTALR
jgi:hypothetical protein